MVVSPCAGAEAGNVGRTARRVATRCQLTPGRCHTFAIPFQSHPERRTYRHRSTKVVVLPMNRHRARRAPVVPTVRTLAVVLALAACGGGDQVTVTNTGDAATGTSLDAGGTAHTAFLTLDGRQLSARTSLCVAGTDDFAATGTGQTEDEPFVLVVRGPDMVVVKFGVRREMDNPPPGGRWLYAMLGAQLRSDGRSIAGTATLTDLHSLEPTAVNARIDISCT